MDGSEIRQTHQLRLVDCPSIYKVLYIQGGEPDYCPSSSINVWYYLPTNLLAETQVSVTASRSFFFAKNVDLYTSIIFPQKWHFEDDFPFPKVGYVNCLEGINLCLRPKTWLFQAWARIICGVTWIESPAPPIAEKPRLKEIAGLRGL